MAILRRDGKTHGSGSIGGFKNVALVMIYLVRFTLLLCATSADLCVSAVKGFQNGSQVISACPIILRFLTFPDRNSFIAPVRVLRMLQIPKRACTVNDRQDFKVVFGRRRSRRPFQGPGVPRVRSGLPALPQRSDNVDRQKSYTHDLERDSNAGNQIEYLPAAARVVGIDPAWHAQKTGYVHGIECQMKPDKEQGYLPHREPLAHHSTSSFGIPIIDAPKYRKEHSADQRVVEVGDDEIRIGQLPVERRARQHDAGKPRDQKLK